ncbi:MAG: hypothetical protein IPI11_18605 [Haliscomenobacter sp.]|nr:hypothetical protein [Haliscomenobacter sp.]
MIKSVKVTVKSSPTVSISSPDAICPGQSATLAASGGGTYSWSTGSTASSITVSPAATTTYTVTVTGSNGCKTIASRTIAVHETPLVSITGPGTVCQGLSATLQAASGAEAALPVPGIRDKLLQRRSQRLLLTSDVSGYGNQRAGARSASQTLSPAAAPQLTLSGGSSVCAGESVGLVASANQAVHFLWSTGAYQAAATSHQTHLAPLSTEAYSVTATNPAGCKDTATWAVTVPKTYGSDLSPTGQLFWRDFYSQCQRRSLLPLEYGKRFSIPRCCANPNYCIRCHRHQRGRVRRLRQHPGPGTAAFYPELYSRQPPRLHPRQRRRVALAKRRTGACCFYRAHRRDCPAQPAAFRIERRRLYASGY